MGDVLRVTGRVGRYVPGFGRPTERLLDWYAELIDPTRKFKQKQLRDFEFGQGEPFWPLPFAIGPKCRVNCRVTWTSPITKTKIESSTGKGGGASSESTTYKYKVTLVVTVCEAPEGGIADFTALFADNKLIWGQDPDVDITDDALVAAKLVTKKHTYLDITSPIGGPNLVKFKPGVDVVMTGWGTAGNNITGRVVSRKKYANGTSTMRVRDDGDPPTVDDEAAGATVTLLQANVEFNANDSAEFTFYKGTATQNPDPAIEALRGAGNQSAHRGRAYIVISNLSLNAFGGSRIPNFTAVVKAHASITLRDTFDLILARAAEGTPLEGESCWDTSALVGDVLGYVTEGPQDTASLLMPLIIAHDIVTQESGGVMRFFHRADAEHVTVTESQLSARAAGKAPAQLGLQISRRAGRSLPSEVNVSYRDPANHLQAKPARQLRNNYTVRVVVNIDLPLVMTNPEARAIAKRLLRRSWSTRHRDQHSLMPSMLRVLESDVLDVEAMGNSWTLLLSRVDQGQDGVIACEADADESGAVDVPVVGDGSTDNASALTNVPELMMDVLDIAAIGEAELKVPGVYLSVALYDPSTAWPGATVFGSADASDFLPFATLETEATAGFAEDPLGTAIPDVFDRASTLRVTLWNGELASVTREEALNGKNLALVGDEIIIFQNATLVATDPGTGANIYELDTLLRGLRDTEDKIDGHEYGERFILLSTVAFQQITADQLGKVRQYKAVANGGVEVDVSAVDEVTHALQTLAPFSPQVTRTTPAGVRWRPRTRAFIDPFADVAQEPLFEETNEFLVEVWQYLGDDPLWMYSSETVVGGDGSFEDYQLPAGAPLGLPLIFSPSGFLFVQFRIYQLSTSVGRGKAATWLVTDYS